MFAALTGGIGCGKSTLLKLFGEHGWVTSDSDAAVHGMLAVDTEVIALIAGRFGESVLGSDGGIDRQALAKFVFADTKELEWLEGVLHPRVQQGWLALAGQNAGRRVVVEVPLLFEKRLEKHFEMTIAVVSSEPIQYARLQKRGLSDEQIRRRIGLQLPVKEKALLADYVILNDGSHEFLAAQVAQLTNLLS